VQITLAYRGRALPLAWLTTYIKPDTAKDAIRLLFAEIRTWLPKDAWIYLIGDREFHGQDMLELIQAQHWIPVVRTTGNLLQELVIRSPPCSIAATEMTPARRRFLASTDDSGNQRCHCLHPRPRSVAMTPCIGYPASQPHSA
jgi:hypothetical protein